MQSVNILRETNIENTPRVMQLSGMFDVPPHERSIEKWNVSLPINEKKWNIGLIVGSSGSGKTTIANTFFGNNIVESFDWDENKSILDGFPKNMGIKQIAELLNSVGFSSPPLWMRPFRVLSNGEKFRVMMARALSESNELCVIDEFTSVVDRTVAKIGSAAISKTIRRMDKKFIAISCHYDIEEWLQPDWVYHVNDNSFQWRLLQRRPSVNIKIVKVHRSAWELFRKYHYLSADIHNGAQCFVAFWDDTPVAFHCYIHFQNNKLKHTKKGHRIVCLPDYQGIGIGMKLENTTASCLKALGWDYITQTAHPARIAYSVRNKNIWKMIRAPKVTIANPGKIQKKSVKHIGRMMATFRYIGPAANKEQAKKVFGHG